MVTNKHARHSLFANISVGLLLTHEEELSSRDGYRLAGMSEQHAAHQLLTRSGKYRVPRQPL